MLRASTHTTGGNRNPCRQQMTSGWWRRRSRSMRKALLPTYAISALIARNQTIEMFAPGVVQYTTDVLFRDLWLRPDLAPRDRSLVTVSALIASGRSGRFPTISIGQWTTA